MSHNTYDYIEFTLKKFYPEKFKKEYQEGIETPVLRFKDRIDLSLNFSKNFYLAIKNIA